MKLFDKLSKDTKEAYLALICCMLIRAATGLTYIFANLLPYIASYIASKHGNNENTYDYYTVKCSWLYTAFIVPCSGIVVFAGKMEQKFGMRPTTILGFILMNIGISASYFVCHSFWGYVTPFFIDFIPFCMPLISSFYILKNVSFLWYIKWNGDWYHLYNANFVCNALVSKQ